MTGETRVFASDGTALAVLEDAEVTWTLQLGKLGTGTLSVPASSPKVRDDLTLIDPGNLVRHTTAAGYVTTWLILSEANRQFLQAGAPTGEAHVRSLAGAAALLDRASVDAEGGMSERAADLRPFGPARAGYDDSEWETPVSSGTKDNPDFNRDPSYPEDWGLTGDAHYIHPVSDGTEDEDPGRGLLRTEFTLDDPAEVTCQLTVDDELPEFWFAGRNPLSPINGIYQWQRTFSFAVDLAAGTYAIFAVVNNLARPQSPEPDAAHLLLAAADADGVPVAVSDTSWKAWLPYPTTIMPGESTGIITRVLVEEAQDESRESIPDELSLGYTDDEDSNEVAWAHETSWHWRVRHDSVLGVLQELQWLCSIDHAEITVTGSGLQFDIYQTYGTDLSTGAAPVRLAPGAVDASRETQPPAPNDVWIRTASGWSHHEDTDAQGAVGVIEAGDSVGVASSPPSVDHGGDVVVQSGTALPPRQQVVVRDTDQVKCGRDWQLGDTVLVPTPDGDAAGRVLKLSPVDGSDERWSVTVEMSW